MQGNSLQTLREYFQGYVEHIFRRPLENLFDPTEKTRTEKKISLYRYAEDNVVVEKEVIQDAKAGNLVKYTINGKPLTKPLPPIYESKLELVDERSVEVAEDPRETPTDMPEYLTRGNLGYDLYFTSNLTEIIAIDIPGVSPERVSVEFVGEYLKVRILSEEDVDSEECDEAKEYLVRSLDDFSEGAFRDIYIDTSVFAIKNLKSSIKDGRLKICIPWAGKSEETILKFKPRVERSKKRSQDVVRIAESSEDFDIEKTDEQISTE